MENEANLPFKVGGVAETRSFQSGYRGAWFRCKIREITTRQGRLVHALEYYDFPDERLKWMRLYQVPQHVGKAKDRHRELMLRPQYPSIYNENQMPHGSEISEVSVIVDNSWKMGDLVDWWTTGCYWSGRITQLLGDDKAQIELKPPPFGEGSSYEVFLKDLRPSLDWSPEHGWTLPTQVLHLLNRIFEKEKIEFQNLEHKSCIQFHLKAVFQFLVDVIMSRVQTIEPLGAATCMSDMMSDLPFFEMCRILMSYEKFQEGDSGGPCARLIQPINQVIGRTGIEDNHNTDRETYAVQGSAGSSARLSNSCLDSSDSAVSDEMKSTRTLEMQKLCLGKTVSKELKDEIENSMSRGFASSSKRITSWPDTDSGQNSAEPAAEEDLKSSRSGKKYRAREGVALNSTRSDTLEAAIMDLEEYVNKVKWLKKILQYGILSSDAETPMWEFVEPRAASEIPK